MSLRLLAGLALLTSLSGFAAAQGSGLLDSGGFVTVKCDFWQDGRKAQTKEEVERGKEKMLAEGMPPQLIESISANRLKDRPPSTRTFRVLLGYRKGHAMSLQLDGDEVNRWTQATDGKLVSSSLAGDNPVSWFVEKSNVYSLSHGMGARIWPAYLRMAKIEQLGLTKSADGKGWITTGRDRDSVSIKVESPKPGLTRYVSHYIDSPALATICTVAFDASKPDALPSKVVVTTFGGAGNKTSELVVTDFKKATPGEREAEVLEKLAITGQLVSDCRFGERDCVQYPMEDRLKTDDEVLSLLKSKAPAQKEEQSWASFLKPEYGVVAVGLIALSLGGWMIVKKRKE